MDLSAAEERLTKRFTGVFSEETVQRCLEEQASTLSREARITNYIPMIAERMARDQLRAMSRQKVPA